MNTLLCAKHYPRDKTKKNRHQTGGGGGERNNVTKNAELFIKATQWQPDGKNSGNYKTK